MPHLTRFHIRRDLELVNCRSLITKVMHQGGCPLGVDFQFVLDGVGVIVRAATPVAARVPGNSPADYVMGALQENNLVHVQQSV